MVQGGGGGVGGNIIYIDRYIGFNYLLHWGFGPHLHNCEGSAAWSFDILSSRGLRDRSRGISIYARLSNRAIISSEDYTARA